MYILFNMECLLLSTFLFVWKLWPGHVLTDSIEFEGTINLLAADITLILDNLHTFEMLSPFLSNQCFLWYIFISLTKLCSYSFTTQQNVFCVFLWSETEGLSVLMLSVPLQPSVVRLPSGRWRKWKHSKPFASRNCEK